MTPESSFSPVWLSEDVPGWLRRTWNGAGDRPVCLWGASEAGTRMALFCSQTGFPVAALVDGSPEKQGREVLGLPVLSPAQLHASLATRKWFVVICSVYRAEITRSLTDMGLAEGQDFVDAGDVPSRLPPDLEDAARVPTLDLRTVIEEGETLEAHRQELIMVRRLARHRPVYVWGAGPPAQQVARKCREVGCPIDGFIESEAALQGHRLLGTFVLAPDCLRIPDGKTYRPFVIVGATDNTSASQALMDVGLCQGADFLVLG